MTPRCGYTLHNLYVYMCEECNLACKHCWQSARYSKKPVTSPLPVEVYEAFIDSAIPLGLSYVKISGGEPLLRKSSVIALVEHTSSRHLTTRLETNGTLIDDDVADVLRRCRVSVSVSLDGATAAVHEQLRVTRGCFDATLAALERLQARKVPTELVFALHHGNREGFRDVVAIAKRFHCTAVKINPVLASGRGSRMEAHGDLLTPSDLLDFVQGLDRDYANAVPRVRISTTPAFHSLKSICGGGVSGGHCGFKHLLGILADGRVSFCGMGYRAREYVFMQAGAASLEDVWNDDPQLNEVRALLPAGLEGVCGNCVARNSCQGGCRAEAYEMFGSLTAPSPGCQRLYDEGLFPAQRLISSSRDSHYARPVMPMCAARPLVRTGAAARV